MIFEEIIQVLVTEAKKYTDVPVVIGSNPPMESIGIDTEANTTFIGFGNDRHYDMPTFINGKSGNQEKIFKALESIHEGFTSTFPLAKAEDGSWVIFSSETTASPHEIGREANNQTQYLYGSSMLLRVRKG